MLEFLHSSSTSSQARKPASLCRWLYFQNSSSITDILSLLPVKSLLRFQCVSKPWFALIHDPYFINLYFENNNNNRELSFIVETSKHELSPLRRWKYDYHLVNFSNEDESMSEPLKIIPPFFRPHNLVIGCCNSLVCILNYDDMFSTYDGFDIVIWNPSIKKYKRLPFEHIEPAIEPNPQIEQSLAFGYDPVNNDYKVLMIVFVTNEGYGRKPLETMVYSMKAHSWRRAEDQWPCKDSNIWSGPAFSNAAFHWLIKSTTSMTLLAFNLTTEKFRVLPIPFKSYSIRVLGILKGSLCVSVNTKDQDVGSQHINVWMMNEYRVESSWSRIYTVRRKFRLHRSLAFSKDGKKVLMQNMYKDLFWYDTNKKTWSMVCKSIPCTSPKYWAMSCVESLFLLDGDSIN